MATEEQAGVVVGVFADHQAAVKVIDALLKAGFDERQLGFAARDKHTHREKVSHSSSIVRGIVSGILGIADMLLVPVVGPADASTILGTVLPVTEEAIDNLPHPNESDQETITRPDEAMSMSKSTNQLSSTETLPTDRQIEQESRSDAQEHTGAITGGVIGGVAGNFLGAFANMGISGEKAHEYQQAIRTGQIIVTVHTSDLQPEAADLLRQYGAHDVQIH